MARTTFLLKKPVIKYSIIHLRKLILGKTNWFAQCAKCHYKNKVTATVTAAERFNICVAATSLIHGTK